MKLISIYEIKLYFFLEVNQFVSEQIFSLIFVTPASRPERTSLEKGLKFCTDHRTWLARCRATGRVTGIGRTARYA
jgi:hypothetical protein